MPSFDTSDSPTVWALTDANDDGTLVTPDTIVSLGDVKAYLNYSTPTQPGADDAQISNLLAAASDWIEREVGPISPTSFTERYDGWGGQFELMLRHSPVISVASVTEQWSTGGTHLLAESTFGPGIDGYQMEKEIGRLVRVFQGNWPRTWFPGSLNVQVVYTAGYATIPPLLQLACLELVAHWWTQGHQAAARGWGPAGEDTYDSASAGPGAFAGIPYRVADKVAVFRRPVLG